MIENIYFYLAMRAWHCVAIIAITLFFFIYASYRAQVEDHIYHDSLIDSNTTFSPIVSVPQSNDSSIQRTKSQFLGIEKYSTWAEVKIEFRVNNYEKSSIWHQEALMSSRFLKQLLNTIEINQTAKEMIFKPFQNKYFEENEKGILRALFTCHSEPKANNIFIVTARGHSLKSANLLAATLTQAYGNSLATESDQNPLVQSFDEKAKIIKNLSQQIRNLKEQIAVENKLEKGNVNIEALALQAEVSQLEKEFKVYRDSLQKVEKLHREKKRPEEYLQVHKIANFGSTDELVNTINQLQGMLINKNLNPAIKKEVEKNIRTSTELLENEIAVSIISLKTQSERIIERKKILSNRIVDLQKKEEFEYGLNPKFKLLKSLEYQFKIESDSYQKLFQDWKKCSYFTKVL